MYVIKITKEYRQMREQMTIVVNDEKRFKGVNWQIQKHTGLQIKVHTEKLFFLFLNQNTCCGYSKEPSQ